MKLCGLDDVCLPAFLLGVWHYVVVYKIDIPQQRLNECLEELGLVGDNRFNELNRTHWSIKRCDLIQELLEAGVQIPVFNMG